MDKRKMKIKLNLFDIIILALVVVGGIAFFAITNMSRSGGVALPTTSATRTVRYTIELASMLEEAADLINEGDIIVDRIEKRTLGKVVAVEIVPAVIPVKDIFTGEQLLEAQPGRITANLTLETTAAETASALTVDGGFIVRAGTQVTAIGPGYAGMGYVLSVERED